MQRQVINLDREGQILFQPQCIHSKNIFSLADLPAEDETYIKIKKHVDGCRQCSNRYAQISHQIEGMKVFIPKPLIDKESKETFEREITELFKIFNLNKKSAAKNKFKQKIKLLDNVGIDILSNLTSKTMIKGYIAAAIAFVALKYFFN